jgi:hypothetical protein
MLWSAILFIWELVGIDLDTAKDEPGNVGAIVKSLKSRQAVPWVLLILVVYFLFKCSIEWAQCHPERRKLRFARIDFVSAWIVSMVAIALYIGQTISRLQFADFIQSRRVELTREALWSLYGFVIFLFPGAGISFVYRTWRNTGRVKLNWLLPFPLFVPAVLLVRYFRGFPLHWKTVILGLLIGAAFNIPIWLILHQPASSLLRRVSRIRQLFGLLPKK